MSGKINKNWKSVVCVGIVTLLLAGCAKANFVDSNSVFQDGIEYYIKTDKALYNLDEDVEIVYRITNLTDQEWGVSGIGSLRFILVAPKGAEWFDTIWEWFEPAPPGTTGFTLQPNGSVEVSAVWPQIETQGTPEPGDDTQVPPGIYSITARLRPTNTNVAIDVTIVPEPSSLVLFVGGLLIVKYFNEKRGRLKNERGRKEKDEERGLCRDSYFSSGRMRKGKSR